jgi:hypothetical protein
MKDKTYEERMAELDEIWESFVKDGRSVIDDQRAVADEVRRLRERLGKPADVTFKNPGWNEALDALKAKFKSDPWAAMSQITATIDALKH